MTSGIAEHTRMRAAVLTGPGRFTIEEVARPAPGPGEVRIRIEGCGVCASNLTPWAGPDWMRFPTVPGDLGHEGWGVVDRVGEGVTNVVAGRSRGGFVVSGLCGIRSGWIRRCRAAFPPPSMASPFPASPWAAP